MVLGVGELGSGTFRTKLNGKQTLYYKVWYDMLLRCYTDKYPSYSGCSVSDDWLNFQNFAEWFTGHNNYGKLGYQLDKDLTVLGNKVYSSETCDLIPRELNVAMVSVINAKGYHWCKRDKRYIAAIREGSVKRKLGYFATEWEAHSLYCKEKSKYLKLLADKYKTVIRIEIYNNLVNWRE